MKFGPEVLPELLKKAGLFSSVALSLRLSLVINSAVGTHIDSFDIGDDASSGKYLLIKTRSDTYPLIIWEEKINRWIFVTSRRQGTFETLDVRIDGKEFLGCFDEPILPSAVG